MKFFLLTVKWFPYGVGIILFKRGEYDVVEEEIEDTE